MKNLAEVVTRELRWAQPRALHAEYELTASGELAGRLEFHSAWGTKAFAESSEGVWTFKRTGFWQQTASIRKEGSDEDLAVFKNNTWQNGGTLTFSNGREVRATTNFWSTQLEFQDGAGMPMVRYHYGGVFKLHAEVEVTAAARSLPETPLLVLFGWYLALMLHRDAAGTAAAAG